MNQHMQSRSHAIRPAPQPVTLGKARKLTRAAFSGNRAEMILDREYTVGG